MSIEVLNIASPFPLASMHMDEISKILSPMTVSSALVFNGGIDSARFQAALRDMITYCPWLVGAFHESGGDQIEVRPNLSGDSAHGSFVCEIDSSYNDQEFYLDGHKTSVKIADLLPQEVHIKMLRPDMALESVQDLPVAAFRLTIFSNHFVIGYRLNHAFYDQCAIVELFNFLGDIYRHNGEPRGQPPRFYPRVNLVDSSSDPKTRFESEEEFLRAAPAGYTANPMPDQVFGPPKTVRLLFDADRVSELRASSHSEFTANDVVNAVLLKALASFEAEKEDDSKNVRVLFARNMRRQFDLGNEIVGDYVRLESFHSTLRDVQGSRIADLAERNHAIVNNNGDKEEYPRECAFFKEFSTYRSGRPNPDFLNDRRTCLVSNWASFPYEHIQFGVATVEQLLVDDVSMMTACGGFVHITFRGQNKHRQLIAIVSTQHQSFIDALEALGQESGLFSVALH